MKLHCEKIYECGECKKNFKRLNLLVAHQKKHTTERSFECNLCNKTFYNQVGLDRHVQRHNVQPVKKPKFQCSICGVVLTHTNHLNVHMRTHQIRGVSTAPLASTTPVVAEQGVAPAQKKQHICSICGRSCSSPSNLDVHMQRHTGQMTKFCDICGKGYPRSTDLTLHMRRHTGEKPFVRFICILYTMH